MGRRSYCPSHPWSFKNSGNTVDSPDHRMEVSHEQPWSNNAGRGQASQVLPTDMGGPAHAHHLTALLELLWFSSVHAHTVPAAHLAIPSTAVSPGKAKTY